MTPIETVQHLYAAFGRGDVPTILAGLADDVDWEHDAFPNPVPWLQPLYERDQASSSPRCSSSLIANTNLLIHKS